MKDYSEDINFDEKFERLMTAVYSTPKGLIRETLVMEDIYDQMPDLFTGKHFRVLDAGAGTGDSSRHLLSCGHEITRIDISGKMLAEAARRDEQAGYAGKTTNLNISVQEHAQLEPGTYDAILCHGMLAWLANPVSGVSALAKLAKPGARVSLLFYNRNRNILRNGILGNFYCLRTGDYRPRQKGGGLTPVNPIAEDELRQWLDAAGFTVRFKSGIRIFYGLAKNPEVFEGKETALLNTERLFYRREPFASIGVHTHLILEKRL